MIMRPFSCAAAALSAGAWAFSREIEDKTMQTEDNTEGTIQLTQSETTDKNKNKLIEDTIHLTDDEDTDDETKIVLTTEDKPEEKTVLTDDKPEEKTVLAEDKPEEKIELTEDKPDEKIELAEEKPNEKIELAEDKPEGKFKLAEDKPKGKFELAEDKSTLDTDEKKHEPLVLSKKKTTFLKTVAPSKDDDTILTSTRSGARDVGAAGIWRHHGYFAPHRIAARKAAKNKTSTTPNPSAHKSLGKQMAIPNLLVVSMAPAFLWL